MGEGRVHGVEERCLLVQKNVRVIGHSCRNRINIFKESDAAVIDADPEKGICKLSYVIHVRNLLILILLWRFPNLPERER